MWRSLAAAAGIAAIVAAWWLWPTDARRVRARLTALASAVSVTAGEPDLERVTRLAALSRGLAPDVALEPDDGSSGIRGREAVVALVSRLGSIGGPTSVELSDVEVSVESSGAHAVATAIVTVRSGGDSVRQFDGHAVRFDFVKADGDWLLQRAGPDPVLARP